MDRVATAVVVADRSAEGTVVVDIAVHRDRARQPQADEAGTRWISNAKSGDWKNLIG